MSSEEIITMLPSFVNLRKAFGKQAWLMRDATLKTPTFPCPILAKSKLLTSQILISVVSWHGDLWQLHRLCRAMKSRFLASGRSMNAASLSNQFWPPRIRGTSWKIMVPFLMSWIAKTPRPLPPACLTSQSLPGWLSNNIKVRKATDGNKYLIYWLNVSSVCCSVDSDWVGEELEELPLLEKLSRGWELPFPAPPRTLSFKAIVPIPAKALVSSALFFNFSALRFFAFSFLRRLRSRFGDAAEVGDIVSSVDSEPLRIVSVLCKKMISSELHL